MVRGKRYQFSIEKFFSGSISSSVVYTREIIKQVLKQKSTSLIIAHNHPSGNTEPSTDDKVITIKIGISLASIDAKLHDHLIVSDRGYYSMAESGWLNAVKQRFNDHLRP